MVTQGGLFNKEGVTLKEIIAINRRCEPPDSGLMCDLLWADPSDIPGRSMSKRGVGLCFGPDVAAKFLDANNLSKFNKICNNYLRRNVGALS